MLLLDERVHVLVESHPLPMDMWLLHVLLLVGILIHKLRHCLFGSRHYLRGLLVVLNRVAQTRGIVLVVEGVVVGCYVVVLAY